MLRTACSWRLLTDLLHEDKRIKLQMETHICNKVPGAAEPRPNGRFHRRRAVACAVQDTNSGVCADIRVREQLVQRKNRTSFVAIEEKCRGRAAMGLAILATPAAVDMLRDLSETGDEEIRIPAERAMDWYLRPSARSGWIPEERRSRARRSGFGKRNPANGDQP